MLTFWIRISNRISRIADGEEGATAVEYGLIVALIAAVVAGAVALLGANLENTFQGVVNKLAGL